MKKIAIVLLFVCLFLTSCGFQHEERGLENFDKIDSDVSLCQNLIPDDFISLYNYIDGDYYFSTSEKAPFYKVCDKALIYLAYDEITYELAKKYAMDHLNLSESSVEIYNEYYFYDNHTPEKNGRTHLSNENYPYAIIRFAYNDSNHTLIFIGFTVSVELYDEVDEIADDWGAFLDRYYGDWYDFSQ